MLQIIKNLILEDFFVCICNGLVNLTSWNGLDYGVFEVFDREMGNAS